jgi:5-methylcytosine-specific restriction endonuclease McrA
LPFRDFKRFFAPEYLVKGNRWNGTIKDNQIRLTLSTKPPKLLPVGAYHNAFVLLGITENDDQPAVSSGIVAVAKREGLPLSILWKLIQKFNRQYATVKPQKRKVVSEEVARPNEITDCLKTLHRSTCQICRSAGFLKRDGSLYAEAHHIIELHKLIPGSYCSDNIIIVCPTCHKKLHHANTAYEYINERTVRVTINKTRTDFKRNIVTAKRKR